MTTVILIGSGILALWCAHAVSAGETPATTAPDSPWRFGAAAALY